MSVPTNHVKGFEIIEITTRGKAALAWDDATAPTIEGWSKESGHCAVRVVYGTEPTETSREEGVEVALLALDESDSVILGVAWSHNERLTYAYGTISAKQLKQLVGALTLLRDEALQRGILRKRPE